jgi:hypothetical protein
LFFVSLIPVHILQTKPTRKGKKPNSYTFGLRENHYKEKVGKVSVFLSQVGRLKGLK